MTQNKFLYLVIAVLALVIFFTTCEKGRGCSGYKGYGKADTVTVNTTDTFIVDGPRTVVPQYVPYYAGTKAAPAASIPPPSNDIIILEDQYIALANKFFATNTFTDSIPLKDSAGVVRGYFNNKNDVSQNKIVNSQPTYQLSYPRVTNTSTTTITQPAKPKGQLYAGIGVTGALTMPVNGANAKLIYKNKKDHLYGVSAGGQYQAGTIQPQFEVSTLWKIKLKP